MLHKRLHTAAATTLLHILRTLHQIIDHQIDPFLNIFQITFHVSCFGVVDILKKLPEFGHCIIYVINEFGTQSQYDHRNGIKFLQDQAYRFMFGYKFRQNGKRIARIAFTDLYLFPAHKDETANGLIKCFPNRC
ncbi:MAG: 60S ribosomal protein L29 [Candidatus Cloacimonetes bacterium]|nr:60S ribosomal protein L29 [Candidatus Cloacimonadota bacterium]